MVETASEIPGLRERLRATWMSGDYGHFAKYLEPEALRFLSRVAIAPGTRVLDVACGAGQTAIPAARAGALVTGLDIASNLIEQARNRAAAEQLEVRFAVADAEMLPCDDSSFDLVLSLIGAMFAPRADRVAAELLRVCRPGGRIAMGNWTAAGHVGQMTRIIGRHVSPSLLSLALKWGDEVTVRERLQRGVSQLDLTRRMYPISYPFPPAEVVEFHRVYHGPTNRAFAELSAAQQGALRRDLELLWSANNLAGGGSTHVEAEFLEVIAVRA